jgi:hypothetical protein
MLKRILDNDRLLRLVIRNRGMNARPRFAVVLLSVLLVVCQFSADGKSSRHSARTAPAFTGCTRIIVREFDKSAKSYMIYADSYDLFTYRLSNNGRRKLANLVNASGILARAIPAGGEQPTGHYKEIYFEFGPRSRWVVNLPIKSAAYYAGLTGFIKRYGRYMNAVGID